jgi:hypothetical protein
MMAGATAGGQLLVFWNKAHPVGELLAKYPSHASKIRLQMMLALVSSVPSHPLHGVCAPPAMAYAQGSLAYAGRIYRSWCI